jgi:hypothetical protein
MWRVNGEYCFHALTAGATTVTGIDIEPATPEFDGKNAEHGGRVRFIQGNLSDPAIDSWAGRHDVVFCSGVLYHVPNPVYSLCQLHRICADTLILTSASTMEGAIPNSAIFLPGLSAAMRRKLNYTVRPGETGKIGLDRAIDSHQGYAPWLWLPTASCIVAMMESVGFEIRDVFKHRRVTTVVARVGRQAIVPTL